VFSRTTNSDDIGSDRRMRRRGRHGVLALVACLVVVYGVVLVTSPWAAHIGGRWTPLLYWTGTGELRTATGTHPLYLYIFPSAHFSRLRLDGLRPTGGVQGSGWLCTSPGVTQRLTLSGTVYGSWQSTDGSLMSLRLLEWKRFVDQFSGGGQSRGYFDLFGYWRGPQLLLDDRGEWSHKFRSGLKIEHASVSLKWGNKAEFDAACANGANHATGQ
jgi:hypothetical protein